MTLTKIASFLTSPVDVVTKTPNDFIRNPSIPTAAKVTAVALSAILLIATFSITYFIGKALLSKAQVQAPPVAKPLAASITPAPLAPKAPSPAQAHQRHDELIAALHRSAAQLPHLDVVPGGANAHVAPRLDDPDEPVYAAAHNLHGGANAHAAIHEQAPLPRIETTQAQRGALKTYVDELKREEVIYPKNLKPASEIDQTALKNALNQFITNADQTAKTGYIFDPLGYLPVALSLLQDITIKDVLTDDDIANISTLSQFASFIINVRSFATVYFDTARLNSLIDQQRVPIAIND